MSDPAQLLLADPDPDPDPDPDADAPRLPTVVPSESSEPLEFIDAAKAASSGCGVHKLPSRPTVVRNKLKRG